MGYNLKKIHTRSIYFTKWINHRKKLKLPKPSKSERLAWIFGFNAGWNILSKLFKKEE
jgi:hypothetical protein